MIRLGHIERFVTDPMVSLAFYRDQLGFRVVEVQEEQFVWLESNGIELLLRSGIPPAKAATYAQAGTGLVLYTDDLPAVVAQLRQQNIHLVKAEPPEQCLFFTDPDGYWFQLVDPGKH